ncbi:N6-adenosine-methyltransferase subunit METTL3-like isoform X2 [Biomphalaria glabrata]|uniref:mRNA m(6)A methyltransferase n=1 Tax=Biomphalaria glabrata TaxID=6526 RepID=A0A9W3AX49_BIOGL|nr:N6-adenosine-methyltransferase subunit METTL3-like isoform X2 [Biomphalaria glabrata]
MSDAWNDIQAIKNRQSDLRAKMLERRKLREGLAAELTSSGGAPTIAPLHVASGSSGDMTVTKALITTTSTISTIKPLPRENIQVTLDPEVEKKLLMVLCDISLDIPSDSKVIAEHTSRLMEREVDLGMIEELLKKFALQKLITIKFTETSTGLIVNSLDLSKLSDIIKGQTKKKRKCSDDEDDAEVISKQSRTTAPESGDIESLLSMQSTKEREEKKLNEEIQALLVTQTAKEQYLVEKFKSRGGPQLQEFCQCGTREECLRSNPEGANCKRLHFKKIIKKHTDESLGDCSFLNTCFHMDMCKYVHYEIDYPPKTLPSTDFMKKELSLGKLSSEISDDGSVQMFPPQWIQCDLRYFDMSTLGKCAVVMADPPWDIHMELPYGTMGDNEMRQLDIPGLQDDGFIFLWVTGRAMELGRECLELWGYKRVDEIIWVKTNQLQRIIRTGRTGHWLNHGKEHCLVGVKGNPKGVNKGMDCDVIVAEVRATSHKPDEIYGIIERLSPGTRKVELFGRPHNVQPNWITLGNQLEGVRLKDPDIVKLFREKYPDGNCMGPPKK